MTPQPPKFKKYWSRFLFLLLLYFIRPAGQLDDPYSIIIQEVIIIVSVTCFYNYGKLMRKFYPRYQEFKKEVAAWVLKEYGITLTERQLNRLTTPFPNWINLFGSPQIKKTPESYNRNPNKLFYPSKFNYIFLSNYISLTLDNDYRISPEGKKSYIYLQIRPNGFIQLETPSGKSYNPSDRVPIKAAYHIV